MTKCDYCGTYQRVSRCESCGGPVKLEADPMDAVNAMRVKHGLLPRPTLSMQMQMASNNPAAMQNQQGGYFGGIATGYGLLGGVFGR